MILQNKWVQIALLWFLLGALLIYAIPPRYGDPLHYLSVAWEMYKNHFYLSTYSSGNLDLQKTPLFYWPIVAGWRAFGLNTIWPYVFVYLVGWFNLLLTAWLAYQLFRQVRLAWLSLFILATSFYWPIFCQDIRFESLMVFFGLCFLNFSIKAETTKKNGYWVLAALSLGLCTFSKGIVAFLFYLPMAALAPLFLPEINFKNWCGKLLLMVICSLLIPVLWLFSIYLHFGFAPIHFLLVTQITHRVGFLFSKFYFPSLRIVENLLPWTLLYLVFLLKSRKPLEKKIMVFWSMIFIQLLFFGIVVKMQRMHYLIPLYPFLAIIMASTVALHLNDKQVWSIGIISLCVFAIYQLYSPNQYKSLLPISLQLHEIQNKGEPVAQFSLQPGYQNFEFLGRLTKDIPVIVDQPQQTQWIKENPQGWVIDAYQKLPQQCQFHLTWDIGNHWILTLATTQKYLECVNHGNRFSAK